MPQLSFAAASAGLLPASEGGDVPRLNIAPPSPPPSPSERRIADRVAQAWFREHPSAGIEHAVGTVATLAQLADEPRTALVLRSLEPLPLWRALERIWALRWIHRPELTTWAAPLHAWLTVAEPDRRLLEQVTAVTAAALDADLLQLTGHPDTQQRRLTDPLGAVLTALRSEGAQAANAEIHSPTDVAALLNRVLREGATGGAAPEPTGWFYDPTAGTGGLLRAAAHRLAAAGEDVHAAGWAMNDVDPLAAACCAANALVWDLGPRVLVSCSDILTAPDETAKAWQERQAILTRHAGLVQEAQARAAVSQLLTMTPPSSREG